MRNRLSGLGLLTLALGLAAQTLPPWGDDQAGHLKRKIESGEVVLDWAEKLGNLAATLKHFNIDPESQVLVFSKTSFQTPKISPAKPRAIFFNDETIVGSVQGSGILELAGLSAKDGISFYTMETAKGERPKIERQGATCLSCHAAANQGIGGLMINSVFPGKDGTPLFLGVGTFAQTTDHRNTLEERWGGWYVSGTHGKIRHMGNAVAPDPTRPGDLETEGTQNLTSLATKFDGSTYLQPNSDIVALMTLEHQVTAMNLIARLSTYSANLARGDYAANEKRLTTLIDETVAYVLFVDEVPLKAPVQGVNNFAKNFEARGPRDPQGRSLREFDLKTRMFKYPLSYMVFSDAFNQLPERTRDRLWRKIYDVLTGAEKAPRFAKLAPVDRKNVLEILRATKPDLPDYWRS